MAPSGANTLQTPLLKNDVEAQSSGNQHSECVLHSSCFLSTGKQAHASSQADAEQRKVQRKILAALILAFIFMCVEVVGGYLAHSVAIMSDAAHMLSDVASFALSLTASYAVTWVSHRSYSFGYHRAEIIGALFSTLTIWAVTGALVWEAIQRVIHPEPVDGKLMFIVASAGVVFNLLLGWILGEHHSHGLSGHGHDHDHDHGHGHGHDHGHGHAAEKKPAQNKTVAHDHSHHDHDHHDHDHHDHDHSPPAANGSCSKHHDHDHDHDHDTDSDHDHHDHDHDHHGHGHGHDHGHGHSHANLNMRSAIIHVLGDLLQSIGVAIAGALIWYKKDDPRWVIADPICTFVFAILVLMTTKNIIQDIIHTLMEKTPVQHDIQEMTAAMNEIKGVVDVHDLHVWNLSMGIPILTAHIHADPNVSGDRVLKKLERFIRSRGINHSTVQICNPVGPAITKAAVGGLPDTTSSESHEGHDHDHHNHDHHDHDHEDHGDHQGHAHSHKCTHGHSHAHNHSHDGHDH